MSVRMQARTLQRLRSALADMDGVSLVSARHGCVLSVLPPGPCLSRAYGVEPYKQYADVLAWHERRQNARPKQITPGVVNPYSKYEEPKPWAAIHARFIEQAVRNRPANKNRMRWDRMVQRQLQMMKHAWTRKYNCWRNQEVRREAAETRWDTRRKMQESEAAGKYLFQEEYQEKVNKMLAAAAYRPFNRVKKPDAPDEYAKDSLLDGVDDSAGGAAAGALNDATDGSTAPKERKSVQQIQEEVQRSKARRSKREL